MWSLSFHCCRPKAEGRYGFSMDGVLGGSAQLNGWQDDYADFFLQKRLAPQFAKAAIKFREGYGTSNEEMMAFSRLQEPVFRRAAEALAPVRKCRPSLLHGDLWVGNCGAVTSAAPTPIAAVTEAATSGRVAATGAAATVAAAAAGATAGATAAMGTAAAAAAGEAATAGAAAAVAAAGGTSSRARRRSGGGEIGEGGGGGAVRRGREAVVFDPACWYGHSEFDLALGTMFGGFGPPFYDVYHAIIPKAEGFEERQRIYKLYHYLNHLNLHGAGFGYGGSAEKPQGYYERVTELMELIAGRQ
ncbi:unnamed protein product [Phaeothamnion confervicola]